jgi:hypothetical protein
MSRVVQTKWYDIPMPIHSPTVAILVGTVRLVTAKRRIEIHPGGDNFPWLFDPYFAIADADENRGCSCCENHP